MFCPVCKTEYRDGFTVCSDCHAQLIPELSQKALAEPRENVPMNGLITSIRKNKSRSWFFALSVGILFRFLYALAKNGIWNSSAGRKLANLIAKIDTSSSSEFQIDTSSGLLMLNFIAELSSAVIPALICGALLIRIFQEKASLFTIGAIASFLVLDSRLWRYWNDPNVSPGFKIVGFAAPLLVGLVLESTVWLLLKKQDRAKTFNKI